MGRLERHLNVVSRLCSYIDGVTETENALGKEFGSCRVQECLFESEPATRVVKEGNVFVTGGYRGTAVFDAITLHSAGNLDIFVVELNANSDDDDCKGSRCGQRDDDNGGNQEHGGDDKN